MSQSDPRLFVGGDGSTHVTDDPELVSNGHSVRDLSGRVLGPVRDRGLESPRPLLSGVPTDGSTGHCPGHRTTGLRFCPLPLVSLRGHSRGLSSNSGPLRSGPWRTILMSLRPPLFLGQSRGRPSVTEPSLWFLTDPYDGHPLPIHLD